MVSYSEISHIRTQELWDWVTFQQPQQSREETHVYNKLKQSEVKKDVNDRAKMSPGRVQGYPAVLPWEHRTETSDLSASGLELQVL